MRLLQRLSVMYLAAVLLPAAGYHLHAQLTGKAAVQGTVTDSTGAVIPKATVVITDLATHVATRQSTTGAGFYSVNTLSPGDYTLSVEAAGFARVVQDNVVVNALETRTLNFTLKPGANETVTVTSAPPNLDKSNGTLGSTMGNRDYQSLPLVMSGAPRDPTAFIYLQPGVTSDGHSGQFNGGESYNNETYVEGVPITDPSQSGANSTFSRGASVDAVDQFQVQTSGSSAVYQGQGFQNYELKSGTDKFHGEAFEFFRNTALDTWGFFAKNLKDPATGVASKPPEHQNEFGGTFGGPLFKNKLFFFYSFDDMHYTHLGNPGYVTIPTLQMRTGDFSQYLASNGGPGYVIYDPRSQACAGSSCTKTAFPGNIIPAGELSPQAQYMESFLPAPTNNNLTNNYLAGFVTGFTYMKNSIKVDYDLSSRQRVSFLYLSGNRNAVPSCCDSAGIPPPYTSTVGNSQQQKIAIFEHLFTITPHVVNQFKYAYSRQGGTSVNPAEGNPIWAASAAGLGNIPAGQAADALPRISFAGTDAITEWGSGNTGNSSHASTFILIDTLSITRGIQSIVAGAQMQWEDADDTALTSGTFLSLGFSPNETANFNPGTSTINSGTGLGYASFLAGAADSGGITDNRTVVTVGGRYRSFSPFVQDDLRLSQKFTANLGLRWDIYTPYREVQNRLSFLNLSIPNPIANGAMGALQFAGDGPYGCHCNSPLSTWLGNVGPHLGFAYQATPTTVFRGAYNLAFTHAGGVGGRGGDFGGSGQLGFTGGGSFSSLTTGQPAFFLQSGLPSYTLPPSIQPGYGTGYTTTAGYTGSGTTQTIADPYLGRRTSYYDNFNLGLQQEIYKKAVLSVDYSGSTGHFLATSEGRGIYSNQLNPEYYTLGTLLNSPASAANIAKARAILPSYTLPFSNYNTTDTIGQSLRPFPEYNGISDIYGNFGNSSYNSLQISLKQQPLAGLSYTVNYTWSKLMDDTGTGRSAYNNAIERSLSTTDVPNNLNIYGVWTEPYGHTGNRLLGEAIRDWAVSGIFRYTTGGPLAFTSSGCTTFAAGTCEPYLNPAFTGSPRVHGGYGSGITAANASSVSFLDPHMFVNTSLLSASPYAFTFGNAPRTYAYKLRGPGSNDIDASLRRDFPIHERLTFEFQADVFNLVNNVRFSAPGVAFTGFNATSGVPNGGFGAITGQSNTSRDIQLAARIKF